MERILLACSGDLPSSVALALLRETQPAEVIALVVDVGQGRQLEDVRDRAIALGAVRAHVIDAREGLARDVILPALQAGALDDRRPHLVSALARPAIARQLIEIARIEGATAVAHASAGDRPALAELLRSLDPSIKVLAPLVAAGVTRAADLLAFARQRGIPIPLGVSTSDRIDANIWGRTVASAAPNGDWPSPVEDQYLLTRAPEEAPDEGAFVEIEFARGVPVRINGVSMSLVELIQSLETIAGSHGAGRLLQIDGHTDEAPVRRIVEAPAAVVLHAAHRDLQRTVIPADLDRLASALSSSYGDLIADGGWFTASRSALDAFVAYVQQAVSGVVRLKLFKGGWRVVDVHAAVPTDAQTCKL